MVMQFVCLVVFLAETLAYYYVRVFPFPGNESIPIRMAEHLNLDPRYIAVFHAQVICSNSSLETT